MQFKHDLEKETKLLQFTEGGHIRARRHRDSAKCAGPGESSFYFMWNSRPSRRVGGGYTEGGWSMYSTTLEFNWKFHKICFK